MASNERTAGAQRTMVVRVRRTGGHVQEFTVRVGKHTTVLDALEQIRGEQDRSLLYRHSCHHGSCGTCGVIVNGKRMLGCVTPLATQDEPVELEPLSPFPVIGDLAVDPTPLYDEFPNNADLLRPSETAPESPPPEEVERSGYVRFENCIECGLCESSCPVLKIPGADGRFRGPAALAAYSREIEKHPERERELLAEIDGPRGVQGCERAFECSRICPQKVAPAKHIAMLQRRMDSRKSPV